MNTFDAVYFLQKFLQVLLIRNALAYWNLLLGLLGKETVKCINDLLKMLRLRWGHWVSDLQKENQWQIFAAIYHTQVPKVEPLITSVMHHKSWGQ